MTHVTVITQPVGSIGQSQMRSLLEIMTDVADVSLVGGPLDDPYLQEYQSHQYTDQTSSSSLINDATRFIRDQLALCRVIDDIDTDIFWFNGMQLYVIPILYAKRRDIPVVVQPKGDVSLALYLNWETHRYIRTPIFWALRGIERLSYTLADYNVFYSSNMAKEYGVSNAITDGMRFISDPYSYEIPFDERDSRIGFLGRHDADKNIDVLIDIAKQVDSEFHFAGTGPQLEWVKDQTAADDSITVHGWIDNPSEFLNELQLLVYPSTPIEGLPTTIMEAHTCGTPTITTPVSGNPDIIIDGETGFLIDNASSDDFVDRIENTNEETLQEMSRNCREMAAVEFTKEAAVKRYKSILNTIISGK